MYFDQQEYDIRFEWGLSGLQALAPFSDVVIIVDVLSFTTCVDVVVSKGGVVFPYTGSTESLDDYAKECNALIASKQRTQKASFSLSPTSLLKAPQDIRLILPSPNGSTLSVATPNIHTLAGCLRNAQAVAHKAMELGKYITVIAAGERWQQGALLRPAIEDLIGAGAIIAHLKGEISPEAESALASFQHVAGNLHHTLSRCSSGKELIGRGFAEDVYLASQLNVSQTPPLLINKAYQNSL